MRLTARWKLVAGFWLVLMALFALSGQLEAAYAQARTSKVPDWDPQKTSIDPAYVAVVKNVLGNGLGDPREGQFCRVEIALGDATGSPVHAREGFGWVSKDRKRATLLDGVEYSTFGEAAPADLDQTMKTLVAHRPISIEPVGVASVGSATPALLLVVGKSRLAEAVAKSEPRQDVYPLPTRMLDELRDRYKMLCFQALMDRRDHEAREWVERLVRVSKVEFDGWDQRGSELRTNQAIETDVRRRVEHPKREPVDLKSVRRLAKPKRIAALIRDLDTVAALPGGEPGGMEYDSDPVYRALVTQGQDAVPALLDAIDKDNRYTRSVWTNHSFTPSRQLESVKDVAWEVLITVWPRAIDFEADSRRPADLTRLREEWTRSEKLSVPERWLEFIRYDNSGERLWLTAGRYMVKPTNLAIGHTVNEEPRRVTPVEAVAVAEHFCKCVDLKPLPRITAVRYTTHESTTFSGVARYRVEMAPFSRTNPYVVEVDAVSGDVMFASNFPPDTKFVAPPKTTSDEWLRRLGRNRGIVYDLDLGRYDMEIDGRRLCNLNGDTEAAFYVQNGIFSWFLAPGAAPPRPEGRPSISVQTAIAAALVERKRTVPNWPLTLETRTEPVVFYDENTKSSNWAWRVSEGSVIRGKFNESWTHFVDAKTGRIITNDQINFSRFYYKSRPARVGLAHMPRIDLAATVPKIAKSRLDQLGRTDLAFNGIESGGKYGLSSGRESDLILEPDSELSLGSKGELLAFGAPTPEGQMDETSALKAGTALIRRLSPKLPEGRFDVQRNQPGSKYSHVFYRQTAFGYPYFNSVLVSVDLNHRGQVARFSVTSPAARPDSVPGKILSPGEVESRAQRLANSNLHADTLQVRYTAIVKVQNLGWYVDQTTRVVRLAYMVSIMFESQSQFGSRGGGSVYPFDAETGRCLRSFPG
jgi:hypothetical protein